MAHGHAFDVLPSRVACAVRAGNVSRCSATRACRPGTVNPGEPTVPAGWAYRFVDPQTGTALFIDHCRSSDGAFVDAKSKYAFLLRITGRSKRLKEELLKQARLQLRVAQTYGGRALEFWFEEQKMADFAREAFENAADLNGRVIARHVAFKR